MTPLLKQWTYQAMAHELIGLHNNVLDLSKVLPLPLPLTLTLSQVAGGKKDAEEALSNSPLPPSPSPSPLPPPRTPSQMVMDPRSDSFYAENLHLNFGEIGENIKHLVDECLPTQPAKQP